MDREVARPLIDQELGRLRRSSYQELLKLLNRTSTAMLEGPDGVTYQMETQTFWDSKPGGNVR